MTTDIDQLNKLLMDTDILKALEEGKMDEVKKRLTAIFGKEGFVTDEETKELLRTIEDLESVDEETAIQKAKIKSQEIAEKPTKEEKELE